MRPGTKYAKSGNVHIAYIHGVKMVILFSMTFLLLSGCVGQDIQPTPAPAPSPTATATPKPTSTPDPRATPTI
jgi:hypothetical protein